MVRKSEIPARAKQHPAEIDFSLLIQAEKFSTFQQCTEILGPARPFRESATP